MHKTEIYTSKRRAVSALTMLKRHRRVAPDAYVEMIPLGEANSCKWRIVQRTQVRSRTCDL